MSISNFHFDPNWVIAFVYAVSFLAIGYTVCRISDHTTAIAIGNKIRILFRKARAKVARLVLKYYYGEETR